MNRLSLVHQPNSSPNRAGKLLVANPHLVSSPFAQSVVFLVQDDSAGTFGVILNLPANQQISKKWNELVGSTTSSSDRLGIGGPMSGPVLAIHPAADLGEVQISPKLFVSTSQEKLVSLVNQNEIPYRVFFGVSAWKPGQLDQEMNRGIWMIDDASPEFVLTAQEDAWVDSVRHLGQEFYCRVFGVNAYRINPLAN